MSKRLFLLLLILIVCLPASGIAKSFGIRVEVDNRVDKLVKLHGTIFDQVLQHRLLQRLKDYKHWDFGESLDSDFRLVLQITEGVRGIPSELRLVLELFEGPESVARWPVKWREPGYQEGFRGTPHEIAYEVMEALSEDRGGPLTDEALGVELLKVPVALGARVQNAESIVTSLSQKRYAYLKWSAFAVHCPSSVRARLDCNGTGRFMHFNPQEKATTSYPALEIRPVCIYDDESNRTRRVQREDNLVSLVPREINLHHYVKDREPLHYKPEDCR